MTGKFGLYPRHFECYCYEVWIPVYLFYQEVIQFRFRMHTLVQLYGVWSKC